MAERADMRLNPSFIPPDTATPEQAARITSGDIPYLLSQVDWRQNLLDQMNRGAAYATPQQIDPTGGHTKGTTPSSHSPYADPFNGWLWQNANQGYRPTPSESRSARGANGAGPQSIRGAGAPVSSAAAPFMKTFGGPRRGR